MSTIQELVNLGRDLGYQGEELRKFVSQEQVRQWEEREQELEERKEREAIIREEQENQRQEQEKQRQHILALENLQLEKLKPKPLEILLTRIS